MTVTEFLPIVYNGLAYIGLAFALFFIGKLVYQLFHQKINVKEELVKNDNLAFGFAHVGYFIGLLIAIGSAIVGPSEGLVNDIIDISIYGGLAIILLNISIVLTDKLLLNRFLVRKEIIVDRNAGVGIIEGAVAISSALIIFGAVSGESVSLKHGLLTAVTFWAIGQLALIVVGKVYNAVTPYDIHEHIEKDNLAVGIGFAGAIIAMGNLIGFGLQGEFESWGLTLSEAGLEALAGLILLPVMRFVSDKILLPGESLTDEIINQDKPNIGAALIEAFSYVGASVLITWCL